jgi:hypothetical protein
MDEGFCCDFDTDVTRRAKVGWVAGGESISSGERFRFNEGDD